MSILPFRAGSKEYARDYNLGWNASVKGCGEVGRDGKTALDRADERGVSHAWHDGYMDHAAGRDKWTMRDERLAGDHEPEPEQAPVCAYSAAHAMNGIPATTAIDCGPAVGTVDACQGCADFYARMS